MQTVSLNSLLLLSSFIINFCNGQTCTSPVYSNSVGATIRGPCPSSRVIAPVGSTVTFTCSFAGIDHTQFWNVSDLIFITGRQKPPNTNVSFSLDYDDGSDTSGSTILTVPVENKYLTQLLIIKCGLCHLDGLCSPSNLQDNSEETLTTLPIELISFGK